MTITPYAKQILYGSICIISVLIGLLVYEYTLLAKLRVEHATLEQELGTTKATLAAKESEAGSLGSTLEEIRQAYALSEENGSELQQLLTEETNRNQVFEKQISDISGTVGVLDKLAKTDPELLQKYSKVYFLNEHYMPGIVLEIPTTFRLKTNEPEFIHEKVSPFLIEMLTEARDDGVELLVVSAYRSFDEQKAIKNTYAVQYGSGANTFSADQGYSEHQLGTTVDFATTATGGGLTGFDTTLAYEWLSKNAYKYGFVLSYPKDNVYYIFEPWHWRFVGEDLARDLHKGGKYFYDLDQREIDTYLVSLFD